MEHGTQRYAEHLRRQLAFLERSAAVYDAGVADEATRIATSIRVVVHDTTRSSSLLKLLAALNIKLLSTCMDIRPMIDGSDPFYAGTRPRLFNGMAMFSSGVCRAKLGDGPFQSMLPVDEWWRQTVYILGPATLLSRRDIVLTVANKDGGAHVDEQLPEEYEALITPGSLGVLVGERNGKQLEVPISDGHFLALRQIAYELLYSEELVRLAL